MMKTELSEDSVNRVGCVRKREGGREAKTERKMVEEEGRKRRKRRRKEGREK